MSDPVGITPNLIKVATFLYRFPLPATKHLGYQECFARSLGDEIAAKTIKYMDQARKELATELATANPNYGNVVASAERYVPLIAQTLLSLERAKDPVYLDKPLTFTWATGIGQAPRTNWINNQAVVWDKCMALASKAIAHADCAIEAAEHDGAGDRYGEAKQQLCIAAGIFERLFREELPRWIGETSRSLRLPEATEGICEGMAPILLAEAQQMMVGKALKAATATPPGLLAKLCLGIARQMEDGVAIMRSKGGMGFSNLDPAILLHVTLVVEVHTALAYRFLAVEAWSKDQYGKGVAFMQEALRHIRQRPDLTSAGVPRLEGAMVNISLALSELRKELTALYNAYNGDNSKVYYDPLPHAADLELPQPLSRTQAVPCPVPTEPVVLTFKPTTKPEEAAPADGTGAAAANSEAKTDEQLAEELHEKLNAK